MTELLERLRPLHRRRRADRRHLLLPHLRLRPARRERADHRRVPATRRSGAPGGRLQKVTYLSSSMVFESTDRWPSAEGDERRVPPPLSSYGFQKLAVEYFARAAWDQYSCRTRSSGRSTASASARAVRSATWRSSGNVKLAMSHVVPTCPEGAQGPGPAAHPRRRQQVRHYTYGGDLARGIVTAMEHPEARNEDFNLSTAESTTVLELAELIWTQGQRRDGRSARARRPFEHDVQRRVPAVDKATRRARASRRPPASPTMLDEVIPWMQRAIADGSCEHGQLRRPTTS